MGSFVALESIAAVGLSCRLCSLDSRCLFMLSPAAALRLPGCIEQFSSPELSVLPLAFK